MGLAIAGLDIKCHHYGVAPIVKRTLGVFALLVLLVLCCCLWAYRKYELHREENARTSEVLDATYRARQVQFQRDLPLGTTRSEVERYLTSQGIPYTKWREIMVPLGDEPGDGFVCDRWGVSVYFVFTRAQAQTEQSPTDALSAISLKRIGHCL